MGPPLAGSIIKGEEPDHDSGQVSITVQGAEPGGWRWRLMGNRKNEDSLLMVIQAWKNLVQGVVEGDELAGTKS